MSKPKNERLPESKRSSRIRKTRLQSGSGPTRKLGASSKTRRTGGLLHWSLTLQGTLGTLFIHSSRRAPSGCVLKTSEVSYLKLSPLAREFLGETSQSLSSMYSDLLQST